MRSPGSTLPIGKYSWLHCEAQAVEPAGTTSEDSAAPLLEAIKTCHLPFTSVGLVQALMPQHSNARLVHLRLTWHVAADAPFALSAEEEVHILGLHDGSERCVISMREALHLAGVVDSNTFEFGARGSIDVCVPHVLVATDCLVAIVVGATTTSSRPPGRRLLSTPFSTQHDEFVPDLDAFAPCLSVYTHHRGELERGTRVDVVVEVDVDALMEQAAKHCAVAEQGRSRMRTELRGGLETFAYVTLTAAGAKIDGAGRCVFTSSGSSATQSTLLVPLRNCIADEGVNAITKHETLRFRCAMAAPADVGAGELTATLYVQHAPLTWFSQRDDRIPLTAALPPFPVVHSQRLRFGALSPEWPLGSFPPVVPAKSSLRFLEQHCDVGADVEVIVDINPRDLPWATVPLVAADAVPAARLSPLDKLVFFPYGRSDQLLPMVNEPSEGMQDAVGVSALLSRHVVRAPSAPGNYEAALIAFFPRQACALSVMHLEVKAPYINMELARVTNTTEAADGTSSLARLVVNISGPRRFLDSYSDRVVLMDAATNRVICDAALPLTRRVGSLLETGVLHTAAPGRSSARYSMGSSAVGPGHEDDTVQTELTITGIERYPLRGAAILEYRSRRLGTVLRRVPVHLDDDEVALPLAQLTPPPRSIWRRLPSIALFTRAVHPQSAGTIDVKLVVLQHAASHPDETKMLLNGAVLTMFPSGSMGTLPAAAPWNIDLDEPSALPPAISDAQFIVLSADALLRDERGVTLTIPAPQLPDGDYDICVYLRVRSLVLCDRAVVMQDPSAIDWCGYRLVSFTTARVSSALPSSAYVPLPDGHLPIEDGLAPIAPWYTTAGVDGKVHSGRSVETYLVPVSPTAANALITERKAVPPAPKTRPGSAYRSSTLSNLPPASSLVPFKPLPAGSRAAIICSSTMTTADSVVATIHCLTGYEAAGTDRLMLVDDLWRTVVDSHELIEGTSQRGSYGLCTVALRAVPTPGIYYVLLFSQTHAAAVVHSNPITIRAAEEKAADGALISKQAALLTLRPRPPAGPSAVARRVTATAVPATGEARSTLRALLIGASNFRTPSELRGPEDDVRRLASALRRAWPSHKQAALDIAELREITGDVPSPEACRKHLRALVDSTQPGDTVVWHYSGYGAVRRNPTEPGDEEAVLLPTHGNWSEGALSAGECREWVAQLRRAAGCKGRVIVLLDCGFVSTVVDAAGHLGLWRDVAVDAAGPTYGAQLTEHTTEQQRLTMQRKAAAANDARLPAGVAAMWHRRDRCGIERRANARCFHVPPPVAPPASVLGAFSNMSECGFFGAVVAPYAASRRGSASTRRSTAVEEDDHGVAPTVVYHAGKRLVFEAYTSGGTAGVFTSTLCAVLDELADRRESATRSAASATGATGLLNLSWADVHEAVCRRIYHSPFRGQKPMLFVSSEEQFDSPCGLALEW
jgi:hypothetical protein